MYNFSELSNFLDQKGYPQIDNQGGYRVIKGVDFEKAYKAGKIVFEDDGIYLDHDGKKYKGYMFNQSYRVEAYGLPKFHIVKCSTIQDFLDRGNFYNYYEFANSQVADIVDRDTREKHPDSELILCRNCAKMILDAEENTKDFADYLEELYADQGLYEEEVEVDIFGYTRDWASVSRKYKEGKGYACEVCDRKPEKLNHEFWWHTHHRNGDKRDNSDENLQCLCVSCHASSDARHQENFNTNRMQQAVKGFKKRYPD
jgi:hypothetical protein